MSLPGTWTCGKHRLPLGKRTLLMGIVNVTPDSFSDAGLYATERAAVAHALDLAAQGADILDVGGESTRPGAPEVSAQEEAARILPVVRALASQTQVPISVDTTKADVANAALEAGACIVNDISGGTFDPAILDVAQRHGAGIVLMHLKGTPRTMQTQATYGNVVDEVADALSQRARAAENAGISRAAIALDPGIGFAKNLEHNLQLLANLPRLAALGYPLLVGASRKSFVGQLTKTPGSQTPPPPTDRVEGTIAAGVLAAANGATILRVHDVRAHRRALAVADAIIQNQHQPGRTPA